MHKLHIRTYEVDDKGKATPVLEHVFYGRTKAQAIHYARSHGKSDSFFKTCGLPTLRTATTARVWHGITCYSELWWSR